MTERGMPPELIIDRLQAAIDRTQENNRLEAMWDSSVVDPKIHLSEEELDEFLETFSEDEKGRRIEGWVRQGAPCESTHQTEDREAQCLNSAVGSIDWNGVSNSDSILSCREDMRGAYAQTMDAVRLQGLSPTLTINGKQVPRLQKEHLVQ